MGLNEIAQSKLAVDAHQPSRKASPGNQITVIYALQYVYTLYHASPRATKQSVRSAPWTPIFYFGCFPGFSRNTPRNSGFRTILRNYRLTPTVDVLCVFILISIDSGPELPVNHRLPHYAPKLWLDTGRWRSVFLEYISVDSGRHHF